MVSVLDQLRDMSVVVADTGDLDAVRRFRPVDCTTNPTLVLRAFGNPASCEIVDREIDDAACDGLSPSKTAERLTVALGAELSRLVPGRVSTEVEARLSFDADASVRRAREIVEDYAARGIGHERILIKLAATWEGIRAAEMLQRDGIDCNLTLVFTLAQAAACADAGAFLISPFVGRITDWYKARGQSGDTEPDPGVASVRRIYEYYKSNGVGTIVMAASFRTTDQVRALAGCDRLTISPALLDALSNEHARLDRTLHPECPAACDRLRLSEEEFRWHLNADAMATEKLAEAIRSFDADHSRLVAMISERLSKN